jgi:hypothetical protein
MVHRYDFALSYPGWELKRLETMNLILGEMLPTNTRPSTGREGNQVRLQRLAFFSEPSLRNILVCGLPRETPAEGTNILGEWVAGNTTVSMSALVAHRDENTRPSTGREGNQVRLQRLAFFSEPSLRNILVCVGPYESSPRLPTVFRVRLQPKARTFSGNGLLVIPPCKHARR